MISKVYSNLIDSVTSCPAPWSASPWLPSACPCLLHQGGWAMLLPSSKSTLPQHLGSLSVPDAAVLTQGALPDPLLAPDASEGQGGTSASGKASGTADGPASRKPLSYTGKHLQQEGLLQGGAPWGPLFSPTGDSHPQKLCHHRVARRS